MIAKRALVLLAVLTMFGGAAVAEPITHEYRIDPVASIVHTSGGLTGRGRGNIRLSGTFRVTIDGEDFRLTNTCVFSDFRNFPEYPGSIAADGHFSGSQSVDPAFPDNSFSGSIVGDRLYISGVYNDGAYDGYGYGYSIEAVRIDSDTGPSEEECPSSLRLLLDRVVSFLLSLLDKLWGFIAFFLRL